MARNDERAPTKSAKDPFCFKDTAATERLTQEEGKEVVFDAYQRLVDKFGLRQGRTFSLLGEEKKEGHLWGVSRFLRPHVKVDIVSCNKSRLGSNEEIQGTFGFFQRFFCSILSLLHDLLLQLVVTTFIP